MVNDDDNGPGLIQSWRREPRRNLMVLVYLGLSRSPTFASIHCIMLGPTRHSRLKHDDESDDAAAAGLIFEKARSSIRLMLGICRTETFRPRRMAQKPRAVGKSSSLLLSNIMESHISHSGKLVLPSWSKLSTHT